MSDWEPLGENVFMHTMMSFHTHEDGRSCRYHSRLGCWTFDDDKKCLRRYHPPLYDDDHDDYMTPEGYDDSPDQGVHRYDGGGTFF